MCIRDSVETLDNKKFNSERLKYFRDQMNKHSREVRNGVLVNVINAKYYWNYLKGNLKQLRTVRVAGWLSYSEFVYKNYPSHVEKYINTGQQLESLEKKVARAEEQIETNYIVRLTSLGGIAIVGAAVAEVFSKDFGCCFRTYNILGLDFTNGDFRKAFVYFLLIIIYSKFFEKEIRTFLTRTTPEYLSNVKIKAISFFKRRLKR